MRLDDTARLTHMLESATEAAGLVQGITEEQLRVDRVRTLAVLYCVQVIGEAAHHVSASRRRSLPLIPWSQIVGMRNRLVHGYCDIDYHEVWSTVTRDLPPLIVALEEALDQS